MDLMKYFRKFILGYHFLKNIFFMQVSKLIPLGADYFIFCERGDTAHDNAYFLFRYYREKHPDVKVAYILDKHCSEYDELRRIGKVIKWKSIKNYIYYYSAKAILSTHIGGGCCDWDAQFRFSNILKTRGKKIFLQHGITQNNIQGLYKENANVDLFICGAKPEYDFILRNFHYENDMVKYTGFSRFDNLMNFNRKNQILIMPTWRSYIFDCTDEEFIITEYYKKWNSLISSETLISLLDNNNITLVFYLHYSFQKYIHLFHSMSKNVVIASEKKYDVQTLLKDSALLITDYSSVYFDFAYMRKPLVYYQFDREEYHSKHYNKGYFDEFSMGFGPVVFDQKKLLDIINQNVDEGFINKTEYIERCNEFFELYDLKNSERIYNEVNKLL